MNGLDCWLTTQPEDEQNALTDTTPDEGCADCGDAVCTCDERCPGCMRLFVVCATKADAEDYGMCAECRQDAAESLRDEEGL